MVGACTGKYLILQPHIRYDKVLIILHATDCSLILIIFQQSACITTVSKSVLKHVNSYHVSESPRFCNIIMKWSHILTQRSFYKIWLSWLHVNQQTLKCHKAWIKKIRVWCNFLKIFRVSRSKNKFFYQKFYDILHYFK